VPEAECPSGTEAVATEMFGAVCTAESPPSTQLLERLTPTTALFQAAGHTKTTDRVCAEPSSCAQEVEWQAAVATATSDTLCQPTTTCLSNEYLVADGSATSDRECRYVIFVAFLLPASNTATLCTSATLRTCLIRHVTFLQRLHELRLVLLH
jgi:hypothetical protein